MQHRGTSRWLRSFAAAAALASLTVVPNADAQRVVRTGAARTSVHSADVNVNRNVNVYRGGVQYDRWGHPLAAAAVATAGVLAVGTMVAALPPRCSAVPVGATVYQNCEGVFYQP